MSDPEPMDPVLQRAIEALTAGFGAWDETGSRTGGVIKTLSARGADVSIEALGRAAESLFLFAHQAVVSGRSHDAEIPFRLALLGFIACERDENDIAITLNNLGGVAQERGDPEAAEGWLREALAIERRLVPGSLAEARTLGNLGSVARQRGDPKAAEELHREALSIIRRWAPGSLTEATTLGNLGIVAQERGDLEAAEGWHREALAIQSRLASGSLAEAGTLNNLGNAVRQRDDLEAAEGWLRAALSIIRRWAPGSLTEASTLGSLGLVAQQQGDLEAAEGWHRAALAIERSLAPGSLAEAGTLGNLGIVVWKRGNLEGAEGWLRKALAIIGRLAPGSPDQVRAFGNLQTLHPDDLTLNHAAVAAYQAMVGNRFLAGRLHFASLHYRVPLAAVGALARAGRNHEAFRLMEETRGALLVAGMGLTDESDPAVRDLNARARAAMDEIAALRGVPSPDAEGLSRLEARLAEQADLNRQILRAIQRSQLPSLDSSPAWRAALGEGTAFISWTVLPEGLLVTSVFDGEVQMEMRPLAPEPVKGRDEDSVSEIREAFERFADPTRNWSREAWQTWGERVTDGFFSPDALASVRSAGRVLLCPDARHWDLGLHLAWIDGEFLCLQKPTFVVHSLSAFDRSRRRSAETGRRSESAIAGIDDFHENERDFPLFVRNALAQATGLSLAEIDPAEPRPALPPDLANTFRTSLEPEVDRLNDRGQHTEAQWLRRFLMWLTPPEAPYQGKRKGGAEVAEATRQTVSRFADDYWIRNLSHSAAEATAVAALYGAPALLDGEARSAALLRRIDRAPIIHLSTHGVFDPRIAGSTALIMEPVLENEGLLTAESLSHRRLCARAVTLSACVSALGQYGGAEGMCGVAYGFLQAGAKCVVSALREVGDRSSKEFMTALHTRFAEGHVPMEQAIRETAKAMDRPDASPSAWAFFTLFGDGTASLDG